MRYVPYVKIRASFAVTHGLVRIASTHHVTVLALCLPAVPPRGHDRLEQFVRKFVRNEYVKLRSDVTHITGEILPRLQSRTTHLRIASASHITVVFCSV